MDTAAIAYRIVDFLNTIRRSAAWTKPTCWRSRPTAVSGSTKRISSAVAGRAAQSPCVRHSAGHRLAVGRRGSAAHTARHPRCRRPAGNRSVQWRSVVPALGPIGRRRPDLCLLGRTLSGAAGQVSSRPRLRIRVRRRDHVPVARARARTDQVFLHEVVGGRNSRCVGGTIGSVTSRAGWWIPGASAIAVLDPLRGARDVLTADRFLEWVAAGGGDAGQTVANLLRPGGVSVGTDALVTDGVVAMASAGVDAVMLTTDGPPGGQLHGVVTARDLAPLFGDQPAWILGEIGPPPGQCSCAAESAGACLRPALPHRRRVGRLAGTLHQRGGCGDRRPPDRAGGPRSRGLLVFQRRGRTCRIVHNLAAPASK